LHLDRITPICREGKVGCHRYAVERIRRAAIEKLRVFGFVETHPCRKARAVEIRRRDGSVFRSLPLRNSKASPLDVKGVTLKVPPLDLVAIVRKGRERG
jgi:hypothetical protein